MRTAADERTARWLRGLAAAVLALVLASCAATRDDNQEALQQPGVATAPLPPPAPRTGPPDPPRVPPQVARNFGGVYESPDLERRLSSILTRLIPASDRPDIRYTVTILNSASVNAFALPDGQLFVTRGLLALANDEAEIAAVIAHEMAHVSARHAAARVEQAQATLLGSRVLAVVTGDRQQGQQALMAGAVSLASFSRQQELEADALGIRTIHRAGYDPHGAVRLLETMDRFAAVRGMSGNERPQDGSENSFLATHPSTPERLALAIGAARQLAGPDVGNRDRDAFLRVVDGMIFGDDPRTGLVRGRNYFHPGFGFAFTAPEGFTLENTARAVIGVGPDGRAMRFDTIRVPQTTTLTEALAASASAELAIEAVEPLELGRFAGATALGRAPGWAFRFVLVRFGAEVYRFIFASRVMTPEQDAEFLTAARSFRRLAPEDSDVTRPQRLRVVQVGLGDTIDSLAERMAGRDARAERFMVLNGLDRTAQLRLGQRVKIVTD